MNIDDEIKIKQKAQEYYEKDLSYNQVYRQGVIDGYAKGIEEFAERIKERLNELQMVELQGKDMCSCSEIGD